MRRALSCGAGKSSSALLALGVMLWVCAGATPAYERVALVVGNGGYTRISKLANPVNDATLMARMLEGLGFDVSLVVDADREAMNRSIKAFGRRLAGANDDAVGLFYYAGHGVEAGGSNYLIPLRAEIGRETELRSDAVPAQWVLSWMEEAGNRLNLVILDACRNNPYGGRFRSASRGLGRVDAPSGSLIAYSAAPGQVAADGKGEHSPYTAALAAAMNEPGLKLEDVFKRVRVAVERETSREQTPWESSSLTGDFYFVPPSDSHFRVEEVDLAMWTVGRTSARSGPGIGYDRIGTLAAGRKALVTGRVEGKEWVRIAWKDGSEVYVHAQGMSESEPGRDAPPPTASSAQRESASDRVTVEQLAAKRLSTELELLFWKSVKDTSDPAELQAYLDHYPGGTYEVLARNRLKRLERATAGVSPPESAGASEAPAHEPAVSAVAAREEPAVSPLRPPVAETMESSLGLERSERRRIQEGLASLGFDPGLADGLFGRVTRGAIGRWQSSRGEAETGFLNAESAKVLLAAADDADDAAFARTTSLATAASYAQYMSAYPAGRHVAEARRLRLEAEEAKEAERMANERGPGRQFRDCTVCPDLVVVPAGSYRMGSPRGEEARYEDEGPRHEVTIAQPLAVGVYEVTFAEWDACRREGGCSHDPGDGGWGRVNRPVIDVSWEDAREYVRWLSRKTGERYRLLSESEWEYAARARMATRYHWGDETGRGRANCAECGSRWDARRTSPSGSFSRNAFGLYDVHGNVWEWVEDCWHDNYVGAPSDGGAWTADGDCSRRVQRGGSLISAARNVRSASRARNLSNVRNGHIGFRVVRELHRGSSFIEAPASTS